MNSRGCSHGTRSADIFSFAFPAKRDRSRRASNEISELSRASDASNVSADALMRVIREGDFPNGLSVMRACIMYNPSLNIDDSPSSALPSSIGHFGVNGRCESESGSTVTLNRPVDTYSRREENARLFRRDLALISSRCSKWRSADMKARKCGSCRGRCKHRYVFCVRTACKSRKLVFVVIELRVRSSILNH